MKLQKFFNQILKNFSNLSYMKKNYKSFAFVIFFILIILISGCKGKKDTKKALEQVRTGSEGIIMSFVPNNPPAIIHVEEVIDNPIKVVLQLNNKGAYPQPNEGAQGLAPSSGNIYLSGYDQIIIKFTTTSFDLTKLALEGKSAINPNGGIDFVTFEGSIDAKSLNVDKYEPTLLSTACYLYSTVAGPQVCIDPDPYSTITKKKVCEVKGISLTNQGAPIAITKIEEEALATKTQFRITIKNVGGGEVIKLESVEKCNPIGDQKLGREDIDKVYLQGVIVGNHYLPCRPLTDGKVTQGDVRLINGEGSIICELQKSDYGETISSYTTPLRIQLNYVYKNTAERKIQIKKETTSLSGGSSE